MANICENTLTVHATSMPPYLTENIFSEIIDTINDYTVSDDCIDISFDTRWTPPLELYRYMMNDNNITSFVARWYEPWCGLLWHATKDGIVEVPLTCAYSSELQLYVFNDQPPEDYIEIDGDENYILWADYIKEVSAQEKEVVNILFPND